MLFTIFIHFNDNANFMEDYSTGVFRSAALFTLFICFILFLFCYIYSRNIWSKVLGEIKKGIIAVQTGNLDYKIDLPETDGLRDVENNFNSMTEKLKEHRRELELQALEIYAKNLEIQQTNMELESYYGQLQATINQLNDSEQKYYSLVKNLTDIVCVIRLDGGIYFINEIVKDILGYSKSEVEGRNIKELIKPDMSETFFKKVSDELKIKNSFNIDLELIAKNGKTILTEATLNNFIYNDEIIGIQAILRDVTQEKKMQQEIIDSYKEIATINTLSRKLNATLDINNVLNLVVQEICRVLKSPLCVLRLLDDTENYLLLKAFGGEYFEELGEDTSDFLIYSVNHDLFAKVINSNVPVIRHDVNSSEIVEKINAGKKDKDKIKELLMVPVSIKDKKIGVLAIGAIKKFNSRQKNLLSSIANNSAIAIENARLFDLSREHFIKTVNALIAAIEAKDKYTEGHSYRVSKYAVILAEKLGLSKEQIDEIRIAGILHDIGKIGIPDAILGKPDRLTDEEFEQIKKHPTISCRILEPVGLPERTMKAITFHHERWDGKGYPAGIVNDDLSIEAQIISVADALDAMTSNRAYRKAMTEEEAVMEILKGRSSQFSPVVVDTLLDLFKVSDRRIFKEDFD